MISKWRGIVPAPGVSTGEIAEYAEKSSFSFLLRSRWSRVLSGALCAAQGLDYRAPLKAGRGAAKGHALVRTLVETLTVDRALSADIARLSAAIEAGAFDPIATINVAGTPSTNGARIDRRPAYL